MEINHESNLLELQNPNENDEDEPHLDCIQNEEEEEMKLQKINALLNQSEVELNKQLQVVENTILVLGNAGCGKTTFVQFMAGDNSKLIAKEVEHDSTDFLISGDKIGSSVTESFTLYPEQVTTSNVSFTDTPGFDDTRSEIHELVASYAIERYLRKIHNVKIVLLVTYYSLKEGIYKNDFVELLKSVNNFMMDINEYKNSIALIATKVPNKYSKKRGEIELVSDEKIIAEIGKFLSKAKTSLATKLTDTTENKKKQFLKNAILLLQSLEEVDTNGNFKRINIFRQPELPGPLSENSDYQNSKISLQKTIYENIVYRTISNNDVGYTLSFRAKMYLNCLLHYINENIVKISKSIFEAIDVIYNNKLKTYTDIYILNKQQETMLKEIKMLHNDVVKSTNLENYITKIKTFLRKVDTKEINDIKLTKLNEIQNYTLLTLPFTNNHQIFSAIIWSEQMRFLLNNMEENVSWSKFLIELFDHFSSYEIQKTKTEFINNKNTTKTNDTLKLLLSHFDSSLYDNFNNFNHLMSDDSKLDELKEIITMTLEDQSKAECNKDGKLTLVGNYVRISAISQQDNIKKLCKDSPIRTVIIYAMHTLFIDADINEDNYKGINFLMMAPKWEIIGSRIINLDGFNGKNHSGINSKSGSEFGERGIDGKPGLPGENGGNFLGIAIQFKNDENLVISAKGGIGGTGQHGGDGYNGKRGKEGFEYFFLERPTDSNAVTFFDKGFNTFPYRNTLKILPYLYNLTSDNVLHEMRTSRYRSYYCTANISVYTHHGDCGTIGERGGNGGRGGVGGNSGNVIVIGKNRESNFVINNNSGISGLDGRGGIGGLRGQTGKPVTCFNTLIQQNYSDYSDYSRSRTFTKSNYWMCENWYLIEPENKCNESDKAEDGTSGYVQEGIIEPKTTASFDFSPELYNYISLLKKLENNKYLTTYIKDLQNLIYDKVFSKKSSFWKFILVPQIKST